MIRNYIITLYNYIDIVKKNVSYLIAINLELCEDDLPSILESSNMRYL